jgi:hypothetical protein
MSLRDPVLVTAATGRQGGATARALLEGGRTNVRVILDGKKYVVQSGTVDEAAAAGLHPGVAHGLTYMNAAPLLARPEIARTYGLAPVGFETWARRQRGLR